MKTKTLIIFSFFILLFASDIYSSTNNSVAYKDSHVRFTIISEGTIRMEWNKNGNFVDSPSFLAINRDYPHIGYKMEQDGKWIVISTSKMIVRYLKDSGKFNDKNLSITASNELNTHFQWVPGMKQKDNLKGTYRTLDGYNGEYNDNEKIPLEDGIIAKDGWTFIDDSNNFLFDNSDWPWVKMRDNTRNQDFYFMAYGHDYKQALKDYTVFAGKIPLPPKYAFGYWWSRYWSYSDNEIRKLIDNFHSYSIPLDVLVVDMDWHYTEKGKGSWTGFTWNKRLFPSPCQFLKYLKGNNLKVTLNLHPAEGIASYEEKYGDVAKAMGIDSTSHKTIEYLGSNKKYMDTWLNTVLKPMNDAGVDFWWLDWQQWPYDKKIKGLSNTWWINYAMFSNMQKKFGTRPMLYHRWGGLGNHRYQVGFSGDTYISWNSLDFQPYFTSSASNVLYGYWSHDIGGHQGADSINSELFTRWMQFGAVSPIMRTHSTKNSHLNKEPWAFDSKHFNILRNTILQRYHMVPYIYTMARKSYDDGISLCRPMYYDYPDNEKAYQYRNEYMFGDNILIYPITSPMENGYSSVNIWLPKGNDWYELHTGTLLKGGQIVNRSFAINEYPIYVKAGSVLPFYGNIMNLNGNNDCIRITAFPGGNGKFRLYEDAGNSKSYDKEYAITELSSETENNTLKIVIGKVTGNYRDMPAKHNYSVDVVCSRIPQKVTVNGVEQNYKYDGNALTLSIELGECNTNSKKSVVIEYPNKKVDIENGLIGKFNRIQKSIVDLKYKDAAIVLNDGLGNMESAGLKLTYSPDLFNETVDNFNKSYKELPQILSQQNLNNETQNWFLKSIDWK